MDKDNHLNIPTNLLTPEKGFRNSLKSAFRRLSITSRESVVRPYVPQQADTFSIFGDPEAPFNFKVPNVIINDGLGFAPTRPSSRFTIGSPEPHIFSKHSSRQSSIVSFIPFNVPEIHIDEGLGSSTKLSIMGNSETKDGNSMVNLDDDKNQLRVKSSCGLSWIVHMICLGKKL